VKTRPIKLSSRQLADILRPILDSYSNEIKKARNVAKANGKQPDWLWNGLISAFATNGGSNHYKNQIRPHRDLYRWEAIERLSDAKRGERLRTVVNPRWREKRDGTPWYSAHLEQAFQRFKSAGGPEAILKEYKRCKKAPERILYLMSFKGIGQKYARDIPMDAYDTLFAKHFAVDARLKSILRRTGSYASRYEANEKYLQAVAQYLKVDCWDLDRTLYERRDEVMKKLGAPTGRRPRRATSLCGGSATPQSALE
jgi:hypothetical protein